MDRDLASPQQYALWEVEGLGLVIAFRGTASAHDVLIDVNMTPEPLIGSSSDGESAQLQHACQLS